MTTARSEFVTPNTSADAALNRPARLPRRQRVAAAIASGVIAGVMLGGVIWGMSSPVDAPVMIAGAGTILV
jgi:ferric-dicitrate binding protein FerR (iron transport regulator)